LHLVRREVAEFKSLALANMDLHRSVLAPSLCRLLRSPIPALLVPSVLASILHPVLSPDELPGQFQGLIGFVRRARRDVRLDLALLVLMHHDQLSWLPDQRFSVKILQLRLAQISAKPASQEFPKTRFLIQGR
jgi:hypothetical protein